MRFSPPSLYLASVLALVFTVSFTHSVAEAIPEKKPIVFVKPAELTELAEVFTYPARVEPRIKASVLAETDGVVSKIISPLGREVKPRTPLLVIRNTDPVYQYSPMIVTSPVAGVVSRVDVTEGSRVSRGDKLALVTDPGQIRVTVELTGQDVVSIHPGLAADLQFQSAGSGVEPIQLRVRGVSPFVDPATGTATCELELAKIKGAKKPTLPAGMIGRVSFRVNVRKGFSISDSALTYRGKDPFVRIIVDGKAKLVPVTLGRKQAGMVEIIKGLKVGDKVVERSSGFVADGEAVEVQSASGDDSKQG